MKLLSYIAPKLLPTSTPAKTQRVQAQAQKFFNHQLTRKNVDSFALQQTVDKGASLIGNRA